MLWWKLFAARSGNMKKHLVQIVPPHSDGLSFTKTQGTKVLLDGEELSGVTRIELFAEVNGIWTAKITCHVKPDPIWASATIHRVKPWYQKLKAWFVNQGG
jgi:hypothetical protein